jgi:hypothetical protein
MRFPNPRDNIWEFIGVMATVFFGIVAIVVAFYIFWLERPHKAVSYEYLAISSLLSTQAEMDPKIKVLYDGVEVSNVNLFILRIWNSGNEPITVADFAQPILITNFDGPILSFDVTATTPDNLRPPGWSPQRGVITNTVELPPLLLNPDDSLYVQLVLNRVPSYVTITGRISGVKEIALVSHAPESTQISLLSFLGYMVIAFLMVFFGVVLLSRNLPRPTTKWKVEYADSEDMSETGNPDSRERL